jgi:hypothetical protein
MRLAGAVLLEEHDEWAENRRYISEASMAKLSGAWPSDGPTNDEIAEQTIPTLILQDDKEDLSTWNARRPVTPLDETLLAGALSVAFLINTPANRVSLWRALVSTGSVSSDGPIVPWHN